MHQKTHVLQVVTSLEPGGLENGIVNFSNQLDPDRFKTSIACLERRGTFADRLRGDITLTNLKKPPGFQWPTVRALANLIDSDQPDILHTHNLGPLIYGVLAKFIAKHKPAIIQGEHGELGPDNRTTKRLLIRRLAYRACSKVHTVSHSLRSSLENLGLSGDNVVTILNGVDCDKFSPASGSALHQNRKELGIPNDGIVLGIVGRFVALKGHKRLIQGFEKVASSNKSIFLLIVGDKGDAKEEIVRLIEGSQFKDQIKWVGFQQETERFFQMMDVLVVPSDREGLSNVMLEAMACGKPCIVHPACGASEVIIDGENGLLRDMASQELIADVITEVTNDNQRLSELGVAALRHARDHFSLEAMVTAYSTLFENTAAKR